MCIYTINQPPPVLYLTPPSPPRYFLQVLSRMRKRLYVGKTEAHIRSEFAKVIERAREHRGTYYYDVFQKRQQGYAM